MRRAPFVLAFTTLTAIGAIAAFAGKCPAEAESCVRQMADQLRQRGWIGIEFEGSQDTTITYVVAGGPAEAGGVRVGDRWVGIDDFRFADLEQKEAWTRVKKALMPGATVAFHIVRDGKGTTLEVHPSPVPEHILAQWVGKHMLEAHMAPAAGDAVAESKQGEGGDD